MREMPKPPQIFGQHWVVTVLLGIIAANAVVQLHFYFTVIRPVTDAATTQLLKNAEKSPGAFDRLD